MTSTEQFLHLVLASPDIQQAITSLHFAHLQMVAAQYGYTLTAEDMDTALRRNPHLAEQIQELILASELEFELDEAEMALIAGGYMGPTGPTSQEFTKSGSHVM